MGRPRKTINAAMLTSSVWVDRTIKSDIGRVVIGDDRSSSVDAQRRAQLRRFHLGSAEAVVNIDTNLGFKPSHTIANGATPFSSSVG